MKRKILYFLIIIHISLIHTYAQDLAVEYVGDSSIVKLKDYYKGYGKIFNKSYDIASTLDDYKCSFTPTINQIVQAEKMLISGYNKVHEDDARFTNSDLTVKNPRKHLNHYYRQYIGLINNENQKVILIHLMNFKNGRKARKFFRDWDKRFSIGVGDFYDKNQKTFELNLDTENLIIP